MSDKAAIQNNATAATATAKTLSYCKTCEEPFNTLQECLAHELVKHRAQPQKKIRKCLDAITKLFKSEQIQNERRALLNVLNHAQPGRELFAVLNHYSGDCDVLAICFADVRDCIHRQMKGKVKVYPFGSLVTGLALKDSDIDLYLEQTDTSSNALPRRELFNKILVFIRRSDYFQDVIAIRHARVPIIRCRHASTGISLDINMSNANSTHNSRFIAELLLRDMRLRELFMFLKLWAKKLKIIGSGSMTSYCLATMIIFCLQQQKYFPSIRQLQSRCPKFEVMGINYGFTLQQVRPLPDRITTLDLLTQFFELYSSMEFEKKLLSPFLACALDLRTAFTVFPSYDEQMKTIENITGEQVEPFQSERCVCVQDPFELQHNVGQSISPTNLYYLRQCLRYGYQACTDRTLLASPARLYDYLLFGLAEQLLRAHRAESVHPAKLRKQVRELAAAAKQTTQPAVSTITKPPVATTEPAAATTTEPAEPAVTTTTDAATPPITTTVVETPSEITTIPMESLSSTSSVDNSTPFMHVRTLRPTNNDLKSLRTDYIIKNPCAKRSIFYYWTECYVDAIKEMLVKIYVLDMLLVEPKEHLETNELPNRFSWLIKTKLDTWSGRCFQRTTKQKFFDLQTQQTLEFLESRPQNAAYAVNLRGRLSMVLAPDFKELRLELRPMPGDDLGLQKNSPLTKFFKALKNMLCNFNLKEKTTNLQQHPRRH